MKKISFLLVVFFCCLFILLFAHEGAQLTISSVIEDNFKQIVSKRNSSFDPDGIKMLYRTKEDGLIWYSNWSNKKARIVEGKEKDPSDPFFVSRGDGYVNIDGNGIAHISGDSPRMYVLDPENNKKWGDVEITVYAKRISESELISYQGIVIGARSEHQDATNENPCFGATYYGRLLYDGRAVFQKEIVHEISYSENKPGEGSKVQWGTEDGTFPKNTWVGLKFVVRNTPDGKSVKLELYRDLTDGKNGGAWEKVAEYLDDGNWMQNIPETDVLKICGYPANKVLLGPNSSIFIRNDKVIDVEYKLFSIREIE